MSEARRLLKAVVDTNIFVSSLLSQAGLPHELLASWQQGAFLSFISPEQRRELAEVLSRPRILQRYNISEERRADFLLLVDSLAKPARPRRRLSVTVRDPKDNHLLAAALGGKTDYLITGDQDLLVLREDPRLGQLEIVTVREFLDILRGSTHVN